MAVARVVRRPGGAWESSTPLTLGSIYEQTCFLQQITGSFVGQPWVQPNGGGFDPAEVDVFPNISLGAWQVVAKPGSGTGVAAGVICVYIPYMSSQVHEISWANNISTPGYVGTANTHCFLRDVWATTGLDGDTLHNTSITNITIQKHPQRSGAVVFDFANSYVHNLLDSDWGGGTAVCIDFPASGQWDYGFFGPTNAVNTAVSTGLLRDSYPTGAPVATANTACGITGVTGRWINGNPDPLGINDGVALINDASITNFWEVSISNGRGAGVECIR